MKIPRPEYNPWTSTHRVKLEEGGFAPTKATKFAAGWDLRAAEEVTIHPGQPPVAVSAGFSIALSAGWEMQIRSRSGMSLKGVVVANAPGTVDEDYRGIVKVILTPTVGMKEPFLISVGDRIAQAVFSPVAHCTTSIVQELNETERGAGGFGSTGAK